MKIKIYISILILVLTIAHKKAYAQSPTWNWANRAGGSGYDQGTGVATDASGNVYATGYFKSDSLKFGKNTLTREGSADLFLVKYDDLGNTLWAKNAGGGNGGIFPNAVCTDASGNVYVTGYFTGSSITFGTYTLTNSGKNDIFIVKYNAWGNVQWAKSAGGSGNETGNSLCTDASGNVYVTGYFESSTLTFGNDTLTRSWSKDIFLAKYDASGNVTWAKSAGGSGTDAGTGISTDHSGNVYVSGLFSGSSITFGSTTLSNPDVYNKFFIAKYDTSGNVLWAKGAGVSDYNDVTGAFVSTDAWGNVYATSLFSLSSITFGTDTLTNTGSSDIFLVKYDASGNLHWAKSAGGKNYDWVTGIAIDDSGKVNIAGYFYSSSITFGESTLTNTGNFDIFISKYDTSGNVLWAKSAGGTDFDYAYGISTDASANLYVAGYFESNSISFGKRKLYNAGGSDIFVTKLCVCNSASSQNTTACGTYLWNGNVYNSSGTYRDTIANAAGCDSFMTLNLIINTPPTVTLDLDPDTVLINTNAYLLSGGAPAGGTYSGPGVNNGKFDPSAAGIGLHTLTYNYTDSNSCTESATAPLFVDKLNSIETAPGLPEFVIYPNPFTEQAVLRSHYLLQNARLTIKNSLGQNVIQINDINGHTIVFSRGNLASGLYFIQLSQNAHIIAVQKILITD